jgi:hypothetical protein
VNRLQLRVHRIVPRLGAVGSSLVLATVLGLAVLAAQGASAPTAHAAPAQASQRTWLVYQRGYYLDTGWLCYGWTDGAYHCTHHWYRADNGSLVSQNVKWVPNGLDNADSQPVARNIFVHKATHAAPKPAASGGNPGAGSITGEILAVFGAYGQSALAVARCESGLNPGAVNASSGASGLFQFLRSTWAGTSYHNSSPFNADANIRAAHEVFVRDGYSWREWVCQP